MRLVETDLPGCKLVEPRVHADPRGSFHEAWNRELWAALGLAVDFVQANVSTSSRGVLRGLHFQWPRPQGKLVTVLEGEIHDVAVDIRRGSPDFGRWTAAVLTAGNHRGFWIPEGFAHGFAVLSERAVVHYLCTAPYVREADAALRWDDPRLAIDWPVSAPLLSDKDARAPLLADIPVERLPEYLP